MDIKSSVFFVRQQNQENFNPDKVIVPKLISNRLDASPSASCANQNLIKREVEPLSAGLLSKESYDILRTATNSLKLSRGY